MLSYNSIVRRAAIFIFGHIVVLGIVGFLAMSIGSADTTGLSASSLRGPPASDDVPTGSIRQP